jgi:hypothetical protein
VSEHTPPFSPGRYRTRGGLKAIVGQMREHREEGKRPRWVLKGAVELGGVLVPTAWLPDGSSLSGERKYDLVRDEEPSAP